MARSETPPSTLDRFREAFHRDRLALVREHGPTAFDQAQVLYRCANTGRDIVVRDAWYGARPAGPADAFVERLTRDWWRGRQTFGGDGAEADAALDLRPVAGLYARYLAEVGFDYSVEFAADPADPEGGGPACAWRMDGRGKVVKLALPEDEGMFRDQAGTFFDARAGWRWLVEQHAQTGRLVVAELQAGYVMGVRPGVPGDPDPAAREDPDLEAAFSRMDAARFDTLEFLGSPEAARYPFVGERYGEWLGPAAAAVDAGGLELFVLADASEFVATVEDVAKHRGIAVEWVDPEDDIRLALHAGPLRVEMAFAYPWLRTLHTARSLVEGAVDFFGPMVDALDEARDLYALAEQRIAGYDLAVVDGVVLEIREAGSDTPVGRWPLLDLVGRGAAHGEARAEALFEVLGYDPEAGRFEPRDDRLDACPVCAREARVGKVIRPKALLGIDPRTLAGLEIGQHVVYYTLECPLHVTPVEPTPGRDLTDLEAAYRKGLERARGRALVVERLPDADDALLVVGHDFGSLVLEPARVRAIHEALGEPSGGQRFAYAFFADALVLAAEKLSGPALRAARLAALEAVQPRFPGRTWPLDCARPLTLDVPPAGRFDLEP